MYMSSLNCWSILAIKESSWSSVVKLYYSKNKWIKILLLLMCNRRYTQIKFRINHIDLIVLWYLCVCWVWGVFCWRMFPWKLSSVTCGKYWNIDIVWWCVAATPGPATGPLEEVRWTHSGQGRISKSSWKYDLDNYLDVPSLPFYGQQRININEMMPFKCTIYK